MNDLPGFVVSSPLLRYLYLKYVHIYNYSRQRLQFYKSIYNRHIHKCFIFLRK